MSTRAKVVITSGIVVALLTAGYLAIHADSFIFGTLSGDVGELGIPPSWHELGSVRTTHGTIFDDHPMLVTVFGNEDKPDHVCPEVRELLDEMFHGKFEFSVDSEANDPTDTLCTGSATLHHSWPRGPVSIQATVEDRKGYRTFYYGYPEPRADDVSFVVVRAIYESAGWTL